MDKLFNNSEYNKLLADNKERLKELACINHTTNIIKEGKPIRETLQRICLRLPVAWQYPENTVARITYNHEVFVTNNFKETQWKQKSEFSAIDGSNGKIEVFYTKLFDVLDEGPFLNEERHLIENLANIVVGYINSIKAKEVILQKKEFPRKSFEENIETKGKFSSKLLQKFLQRQNEDRNIYHDLMPFKVKEILLVANLYDAYSIEGEGRFTDHILGEYHQLNLTSLPRVTGVTTKEEAMEQLDQRHFDMIIVMVGVDKNTPVLLSKEINRKYSYIPIFFLINNNKDIKYFEEKMNDDLNFLDRIYVWNGDPKVFFVMVKLLEDKVNVENDTKIGLVRIILLVEDSTKYYSRYLPILYNLVLEQTTQLIEDVSSDELYKVLKLRARPKILLATNYEEAIDIFHQYNEYLFCLISDVRFPKNGVFCEDAGVQLIRYVKTQIKSLPTVLQSSDPDNAKYSLELQSTFINKNSESIISDIKSFINYYLGFGHFVYRNKEGKQIAVAKTMKEFESFLKTIPDESLVYHAIKNHFSLWLMARGEGQIAKIINPLKITDFKSTHELREFLTEIIRKFRNEKDKGKIVSFDENAILQEENIVLLSTGSLGGKGRGLAFINTLLYNFQFKEIAPYINLRTPKTAIIGTDEFDIFLDRNHLRDIVYSETEYIKVRNLFMAGKISHSLERKLKIFLKLISKPIAVRSSSLFEDSLMQPFSGIYGTYILPNDHADFRERYRQLVDAIKLVFASIFSSNARMYFEAIHYKIEEEKMAVVLQELVGGRYEDYYYPHISGTAQSYNYYPVSHMKPEEGFAVAAIGLGQYVVEGEKAYRFSPTYPKIDIVSPKDLYKDSQLYFYAVKMNGGKVDLTKGEDAALERLDISEAEKHGNLKHCASVYDIGNDMLISGIDKYGPRVINFSNILKYDYIPLAKTLIKILEIVKEAIGSPAEIEFAVNLKKDNNQLPSFYLLQIKPLVGNKNDFDINLKNINKKSTILYCERSMGHGRIDNISDIIFVDINRFENTKTEEMRNEIEYLNSKMLKNNKQYVLVGPGRWGTRDKFIGIPVVWPQISNAKIIVEMSMENFPLDASLGSHFFHNVTSMNIGYFSINHNSTVDYIKWDIISKQELVEETKYFKHVRFKKPFSIIMDGKKQISLIVTN